MSKIKVEITAIQQTKISKYIEMEQTDYDAYNKILDDGLSLYHQEKALAEIAEKYDVNNSDNVYYWDDLEEVEFRVVE